MKRIALNLMSLTALSATVFLVACDWESGSQANFNSRANNVNISGVYEGQLSGGRAVSNTSNGTIRSLNIQQSGNTIRVLDNQGSRYDGRVSAPAVTSETQSSSIGTNAVVASFQLGFSGRDGVAARDIEFSGSLTLATITSVQASSSETERLSQSGRTVSGAPIVDGNNTITSGSSSTTFNESIVSNEFELNDSNAAMRLRGTWVERGGVVASVNAVAPVNAFSITGGGN
ncbi:MAG: hypothetical protein JJU05_14370 [Verrucomicrobia bacterium]|nr:hypothetical protein [Verrucomicrobiota bacterium]MCH8528836.1 hypothetical protein [Kiritimatiellia bacterium]